MKLQYIIYPTLLGLATTVFSSCEDDMTGELRSEARIENYGFTVVSPAIYDTEDPSKIVQASKTFKVRQGSDPHHFYVRISPYLDPKDYLTNAQPTFCLSMGATVTPSMTEAQDFSNLDSPVEYTVTSGDGKSVEKYYVSWTESDLKPYGEGIGDGEQLIYKTYTEMGFPGTYGSWPAMGGDALKASAGDLMGYPAFCGKDKIVVFSRRYAWGDSGAAGASYAMAANHTYAFMVYDARTLDKNGSLNLGGISPSDVIAITSDWIGNMVMAVGRKSSGKTDFYYWTSITDSPIHIGQAPMSIDISNNETDAAPYINVAGDITTNAVIAASAPRTDKGQHYKFNVYRGILDPEYSVIETGHSELDQNQFQMISFFGTDETAPYLVGDTQPNGSETNGQIQIHLNNPDGSNRGTCDYHKSWFNGIKHDDGVEWWVRTGEWLKRNGGRRPTVHAMVLNGVPYSYFTTGSDWRVRGILSDQEFKSQDGILTYPTFGFGLCTKDKSPKNPKDGGMWIADSFGCMADWYFDDETQEGLVAVWSDRWGMNMFLVTCYE